MNTSSSFRDEVLRQLKTDILSFGWLSQIAEREFHYTASESKHYVFEVVSALADTGVAVIGAARIDGEIVLIDPWTESGAALKERMAHEVDAAPPGDKEWAFWLQLAEHYNRK